MDLHPEQIINLIRKGSNSPERRQALLWIWKNPELNQQARSILLQMNAREVDIEDVLQEGRVVLIQALEAGKFRQDSTMATYFSGICKNIYRKRYHTAPFFHEGVLPIPEAEENVEQGIIRKEQQQEIEDLYRYVINLVNEDCRRVLEMQRQGYSMAEISTVMKYKGRSSAKTKALRCREYLRKIVNANPRILQIIKARLDEIF